MTDPDTDRVALAVETPKQLAEELARLARQLKTLVVEGLEKEIASGPPGGPLKNLFDTFNATLSTFTVERFADAYAQTVTYGLWAARRFSRGENPLFTRKNLKYLFSETGAFLRDLFDQLVNSNFDENLSGLLDDLTRFLARVNTNKVFAANGKFDGAFSDPVIHFYEPFLVAYDPERRKKEGVYYTPDEIVSCIVRSTHDLLIRDFGLPDGLADTTTWETLARRKGFDLPPGIERTEAFVRVLDPATGTGTFLRTVIGVTHEAFCARHAHLSAGARDAAWCDFVRAHLLERLIGFELSVAPYIIAHLRLGFALRGTGFVFRESDRLRIYLTNTLELEEVFPFVENPRNFVREWREAEDLKRAAPVTVIVGNPPYRRVSETDTSVGGWVVHGHEVPGRAPGNSLFDDILKVSKAHTIFSHVANLYNLYVYFWRWGIWKVFEANGAAPGVVAMITPNSWLEGPGFSGLRSYARDLADGIWTLDLGGDQRVASSGANVFGIETPVAVTFLARRGVSRTEERVVRYRRLLGTVEERLAEARRIVTLPAHDDAWKTPPSGRLDPLKSESGDASWTSMPRLIDLFPWQQPGCKFNRLWPIAPHASMLQRRWETFVGASSKEKPDLFVTPPTGRTIETQVPGFQRLVDLKTNAPSRPIVRYAYRSFDRQWAFEDPRLAALERPALWQSLSGKQFFFAGTLTDVTGDGLALTCSTAIPDLHYFCGRGGKDIIPLYRDASGAQPNVAEGLLTYLGGQLGTTAPTPEDLAAYVYALLATPAYPRTFAAGLQTPGLRVPLTADLGLWQKAVALGARLLWLHTFAERYVDTSAGRGGKVPLRGTIAWSRPVVTMPERPSDVRYDAARQVLRVGDGELAGVRSEVWNYEVSGMRVLGKWTGYRTKWGAGKAASSKNPLDKIRLDSWPAEWSEELRELVTVLTLSVEMQPEQETLLAAVCAGPFIPATEIPKPTEAERRVPGIKCETELYENNDG